MNRQAQTVPFRVTTGAPFEQSLIKRLRHHFARIEAALSGQSRLSSIDSATLSDTGRSGEDLTGVPTHDPALPFFLQAGFGRHDR